MYILGKSANGARLRKDVAQFRVVQRNLTIFNLENL